jgi:hypothetical protein
VLHELREALFLGRDGAEQRLQWLIKRRGGDHSLQRRLAGLHGETRMFRETGNGRGKHVTALLDLLEIREFRK